MRRHLLFIVPIVCLLVGNASGQAILAKHLVVALGGGGGYSRIAGNDEKIRSASLESSAVRFSFSYALSDRISIGGHYSRIGSVVHPVLDRVRLTSYMIEGGHRIHNGTHAVLEVAVAAGLQLTTLRPKDVLLPFDAHGAVFNGSVRYMHMINGTIGVFAAFDHIMAPEAVITFAGDPVLLPDGRGAVIGWRCMRATGGAFLRF